MAPVSRLGGHATADALIQGDDHLTYGELADRARRTGGGLLARGLEAGDRVAVVASASIDGVVSYLGVQVAGLIPIMLSPRSPLPELRRRLDHVDPSVVLLGATMVGDLPDDVAVVRPAGATGDGFEIVDGDPVAVRPTPDTPAVVLYTSGITGLPKPVVLTHANLAATSAGLINGPAAGLDSSTVAFAGLPLSHVFGLNSVVGTVLNAGGVVVLAEGFDPEEVGELVARHRVTALSAVPPQWKQLAALDRRELFATVVRPTWSAAPMPPLVLEMVQESLGLRLAGGFGLTETSGTICQDDPRAPTIGTVGHALGTTTIRVVDDGEDALPGDLGELWVRGPSVVQWYLDGSPTAITADGWLRTGDIGALGEDGRVAILDRGKDVINVSGFNVSPAEVEGVLAEHPAVATSAVVGAVEDDREVVVAHVVLAVGRHATQDELVAHCRNELSGYKVPRRVLLHDELPVTESGKVVRRLLGTA